MKNSIQRSIVAALLVIALCAAFLPERMSAERSPVLKWVRIVTPGAMSSRNDVVSPCDINRIVIGSDGKTFYAIDTPNADRSTGARTLFKSIDGGITWDDSPGKRLFLVMSPDERNYFRIWNIAIAPDDPNFVVVVTSNTTADAPVNVWVSIDGGTKWDNTNFPSSEFIGAIDVSISYGHRDIAVGTRSGGGTGSVWTLKSSEPYNWKNQSPDNGLGDILALKFSPSYRTDNALVIIYSTIQGTFLNTGIRDIASNSTDWTAIYSGLPPEITTGNQGASPKPHQVINGNLALPRDFCSQSANLRRYYVSTDDNGATNTAGVYRFDDRTGYLLMKATPSRRVCSIAYFGNFASGKLLVGEIIGDPQLATVMTWFTDSPTTCSTPCWYPAMKPPTGAAGNNSNGYANAQVAWSPDGSTAYTATASSGPLIPGPNWYLPYITGNSLDETAFSVSQNNGETWNQLSLIDTKIDRFADIVPSPDCSVLYIASVNKSLLYSGFDSVWRSQNAAGTSTWERVLCRRASEGDEQDCILQLAGDHNDGRLVFWAARHTKELLWSPDYGDFWSSITPSISVQDFAVEDSKTLYVLDPQGYVQKFIWSGKGWLSHSTVPSHLSGGYSISVAYTSTTPDNLRGHVFVGGTGNGEYDVSYSSDGGLTFIPIPAKLPTRGNTLVIATQNYETERGASGDIIAINSGGMYQWSTSYGGGSWAWPSPTPNEWAPQWGGPSWPTPVTSLSISRNGSFYFTDMWGTYIRWNYASAGIDMFLNFGSEPSRKLRACGGLELDQPVTVWLIDQQTYNPPYGCVWYYTDTLLWSGPVPLEPASLAAVGCDPASGRNTEINLRWRPVSLSLGYRIEIAKDEDFALKIADIGNTWGGRTSRLDRIRYPDPHTPYIPPDPDSPALVIPPGGGLITDRDGNSWLVPELEAGHTYYWRVTVQSVATGDYITSPSSWREMFVVVPGTPVRAPRSGPEPIAPKNGSIDCSTTGLTFTWTNLPAVTRYEFVLARDVEMKDIIVRATPHSSVYIHDGHLEPGREYFWQVRALEPVTSAWSFIMVFRTESLPAARHIERERTISPAYFAIIGIGFLLYLSILILIVKRR